MNIIIKDFNGFRTSLEIDKSYTIEQLKSKMQAQLSIPKEAQNLFLNNLQLEDNKKLFDYNVYEGIEFDLFLKENYIKINAVNVMGKIMTFYLLKSDSINNIKKKIQEREGIPQNIQKLILEPKTIKLELKNDKSIQDYNIKNNASIHILYNQ